MNSKYINIIIYALLGIGLAVAITRINTFSHQAQYWHGKYDAIVANQSHMDSIHVSYYGGLSALLDSCQARGFRKETTSIITAEKIKNNNRK